MTESDVTQLLRQCGALLEGHFQLSSGRHSATYIEKFRALQFPWHTERLCAALAERLQGYGPEVVVGPVTGGILLSHEVGRNLGLRALFTEREGTGMALRRGFALAPGEKVALVDDVLTTGRSVREALAAIRRAGGEVVAAGLLVDRSGGTVDLGVPVEPLLTLDVQTWAPADCPLCNEGRPIISPGSRHVSATGKGRL